MFVGWSFVLLKETHRRSKRRRKKSSRPTTENTQTSLRFCVLNLRALISSRACFSLFRALLSRRRGGKEEAQRGTEQRRNNRLKEEDEEEERKRRARDDETSSSPLQKATFGHQKLSLHFPFRVFKVDSKLREKYAENNKSSIVFF